MSWFGRGSRHERGYGTEWDKLRLLILERDHHLCQCPQCLSTSRTRLATEVDHITSKAKGGTDDPSNLRAVNAECHRRLTMQQQGHKPRIKTGIDGYPVAGG